MKWLQSGSVQLPPCQPATHSHSPALAHLPRPLQPSGHAGSAQLGPAQPTPQLHTGNGPAKHGPWPLHMSLQPGRSHAAPDQPAKHWQRPGEAQMPCRVSMWHDWGQMGSEQRAPFQPPKHAHCCFTAGNEGDTCDAFGVGVGSWRKAAASATVQTPYMQPPSAAQVGVSHCLPPHPSSQWHSPGAVQVPRPWHAVGQVGWSHC